MDILKGSGSTFSTSGRKWKPFRYNPERAAAAARLHRLVRSGKAGALDKTSLRQQALTAIATHPIKVIPCQTRSCPKANAYGDSD